MKSAHGFTLSVLTLVISACGGGGGSDTQTTHQTAQSLLPMQGHLVIEERSGRFYVDAWFSAAAQSVSSDGELLHDANGDRCERVSDESQQSAEAATRVSAGPLININSRSGTWAALEQQDGLDSVVYASEARSIRLDWPDDALVDIGGDVFPAVPATALSPLQPLQVVTPSNNRTIPADGELAWQASTDARDHIDLVLRAERVAGSTQARHTVQCRLVDDGAFTVPANVLASTDWIVRAARTRTTDITLDNAVMRVAQVSER